MEDLKKKVYEKIKEVVDPELGIDIVSLGLIYEVKVNEKEKKAKIKMTFTTPGCPLISMLYHWVKKKVEELDEINEAEVDVVWDPPWTPDKMSDEAKKKLGYQG